MIILITGPQGSGKTTQTHAVSQALNLCEIDSGDLIREFAKGNGAQNRLVAQALSQGQLIDNQVAADLVKERLSQVDCEGGVVLDGYPRSMDQLGNYDPGIEKVVYLDVPDEVSIKRAEGRGRADDTEELIKERLRIYHEKTQPVLDHFEQMGKLIRVDGTLPVEEVTQKILEGLRVE